MLDTWLTVLILVSLFNEGPEVEELYGVSEIAINGCIAVILGAIRNIVGNLTVSFCLLEGRLPCNFCLVEGNICNI